MTTKFLTKEDAIDRGLHYAGMQGKIKQDNLRWIECQIVQFGVSHDVEIADFMNVNGVPVRIGVGTFRDGYELWLIDFKTGASQRV